MPGCWASNAAKAGSAGANTVIAGALLRVSTRFAAVAALVRVVRSGLWLAAVATGSLTMPCAEPGPWVGTWSQTGRKMSLILVTPLPVGAVASPVGAADSLAGAEA